jgi:hypothetical protein
MCSVIKLHASPIEAHLRCIVLSSLQSTRPPPCQVSEFQRQQQQQQHHPSDAPEAGFDFLRRTPMDIQMGAQVYEDMPSEMRSRLYYVLSTRDDVAHALKVGGYGATGPRVHVRAHMRVRVIATCARVYMRPLLN